MELSEKIRALRRARGMTQEQVAQALGVTATAVNKWENAASCPDIALLAPLARLLDTPRRIGLCVTDSFLMTPRKSVTAVLGLSEQPVTGWRAGCGQCALREKCEYRKRGQTCEG